MTPIHLSLGKVLFPTPLNPQPSCGNSPLMATAAGFAALRINTPKNCPAFVDLTVEHSPARQTRGFILEASRKRRLILTPRCHLEGMSRAIFSSTTQHHTTPTGLPAWMNRTDTPYSPSGTPYAAIAHYIPRYGSQGLIMILAGADYNSTNQEPGNLSMEVVWFINPVTKRWYSQKTIGEAP